MTGDNRMEQRGRLRVKVPICLLAKRSRSRSIGGRLQEAVVADLRRPADGGFGP
jgi:hypothetical protein